jgi:hypothetical protein
LGSHLRAVGVAAIAEIAVGLVLALDNLLSLLGWRSRRQCRGVIALVKDRWIGVCLVCSVNDITMVGTN